ncbi:zinc-binding dehydrogenase [Nonomuraea sediminis]|uniref:zinc-binding dehydrogenase n=1 Tax=Nonomuraea sediminis TaxID=2835864 RepID=UPI001BDC0D49|nr:zinc-binding dehydrogenase [Nonomuraea sediminis]
MRALVATEEATIELAEVPEPVPTPDQAVVEVHHAGANFGELRHTGYFPAGTVMGFDAAGIVVRAASDGSGPPAGARVAGLGLGAWAERAVFATDSLAVVPDSVELAAAASLPTVGITALRTLRDSGPLAGRRVLITGASGGVGRLAVQLAHRAGAHVIASARRGEGLRELGADAVVGELSEAEVEPVDVVLEHLGGPALVAAWGLVLPGGVLHSIGWAGGEPANFPPYSTISLGPSRTLRTFGDATRPGADMAEVLALVADGRLIPQIGWQGPWTEIAEAARSLLTRRLLGKIVLDIAEN